MELLHTLFDVTRKERFGRGLYPCGTALSARLAAGSAEELPAGAAFDELDDTGAAVNVGYEGCMRPGSAPRQRQHGLGWFFRNSETGDVVVAQFPNVPLGIFLAATAVRMLLSPNGVVGDAVSLVGTAGLAVWAVLEVARGDSPFRRVLGGGILLASAIGVVTR